MIINRIYKNQNLLSLKFVSFLVGLRTYQHDGRFNYDQNFVRILVMVLYNFMLYICGKRN
jgi:hypothetical protein